MTTKKAAAKKKAPRKKPAKQPVKKKKSRARRATKSKRSSVSQRVIIQGGGGFGGGGASSSSSSGGGGGVVYLPMPQFQSNALDTTMGVRAPAEPAAPPPVAEPIEGRRLGTTYAQRRRPNLTNTSGVLFTQSEQIRETKAEPVGQEFKPATTIEPPVFERAAPPAPAEFPAPPPSSAPHVFSMGNSETPRPVAEESFAERADAVVPARNPAFEEAALPIAFPNAFNPLNRLTGRGRLRDVQGERDAPGDFGAFGQTNVDMAGSGPARSDYTQSNVPDLPSGVQVASLERQAEGRRQNRPLREGDQRGGKRNKQD